MAGRSRFTWRFGVLALVLLVSTGGVVGRLAQIQVLEHEGYLLEAQEVHGEKKLVRSERGAILDRDHQAIARSVDALTVIADPTLIADDVGTAALLAPLVSRDSSAGCRRLHPALGHRGCSESRWMKPILPVACHTEAATRASLSVWHRDPRLH